MADKNIYIANTNSKNFEIYNFKCDKCGACCRQLNLFGEMYKWLDNGDGICYYLNRSSNVCTIYSHLPIICLMKNRIWILFFQKKIYL